ncbi:TIGR04283 family arsenosugar biosynthesis glycosyltransferase [Oscillatoria amoena NRMC-F 0135]|nr:TIGR04283 family arsenosugar biosynthesis glycosyltransferase [Geitlerinema splendidum]MDL5044696.1 TIGR04283 family arsenosugar biosynthesis glycosyltransferase [Oscillatoria amoena NRMC-F 0135]
MSSVSVIIPVVNEVKTIAQTLAQLNSDRPIEIIVVDGGSQDGTWEYLQTLDLKAISAPKGRAHQMNAGAAIASGDILVFLHADTRLPAGFDSLAIQALAQPGTLAGAFTLAIDDPSWLLRWIEKGVNARSRLLQLPYGDQALFLKAAVFEQLGGFPQQAFMEDFEFIRRLRRQGHIAIVPTPVLTSARRWQALGVWKTTIVNQGAIAAYLGGVQPERIAQWYRRQR